MVGRDYLKVFAVLAVQAMALYAGPIGINKLLRYDSSHDETASTLALTCAVISSMIGRLLLSVHGE